MKLLLLPVTVPLALLRRLFSALSLIGDLGEELAQEIQHEQEWQEWELVTETEDYLREVSS
jgi:hypothetical protein